MSESRIEIDHLRRACVLRWPPALALSTGLPATVLCAPASGGGGARASGFGIHLHDLANAPGLARLHYSFIRLWDTQTSWRDVQPQRDRWEFSRLDRYVDLARSAGAEIVLTLGQTPAWATSNPSAAGPYGPGCSAPPRDLSDWTTYVGTLARRYKGRIKYWETWNEANDPKFYSGSVAQLGDLAKSARATLKQAGAENSLLSPSIQGGALKEFRQLAGAGVLKSCDIASYHFYAPMGTPEVAYDRMLKARTILNEAGLADMPLWNTELGWLNDGARKSARPGADAPAWTKGWRSLSGEELGWFITRTAILSRAAGIPVVIWYAWDNSAIGFGGAEHGRGVDAAVDAFNYAADTIMKADKVTASKSGDVWQADIQGSGWHWKAFWREDGQSTFRVPAGLAGAPSDAQATRSASRTDPADQELTGRPLFLRATN